MTDPNVNDDGSVYHRLSQSIKAEISDGGLWLGRREQFGPGKRYGSAGKFSIQPDEMRELYTALQVYYGDAPDEQ